MLEIQARPTRGIVLSVFYAPEINYIYRYREAEEFAKYTEFGFDLGSGESFSLPNYYKLCDIIVDALKEHEDLISKYKS